MRNTTASLGRPIRLEAHVSFFLFFFNALLANDNYELESEVEGIGTEG